MIHVLRKDGVNVSPCCKLNKGKSEWQQEKSGICKADI